MNAENTIRTENQLWKDKAIAFVVRAQRELWGKHNEDPMVWFFKNGFKNQFIKDFMIGWNRHSKLRTAENWGIESTHTEAGFAPGKLLFPEGLVIPYIVDKNLKKITIFNHISESHETPHVVSGSSPVSMILGEQTKTIAVVDHIMDGLYLFQEAGDKLCVVIPHNPAFPLGEAVEKVLRNAKTILFCHKSSADINAHWQDMHYYGRLIEYSDKEEMVHQAMADAQVVHK